MSTQHTPGPWSTDGTKSFYVLHNGDFVANASTAANARLIAAAPELLAALEACVSELNQLAFLANDKLANAVIQKGIDAISKAKESQP
jgi:hypothetical protein